MIIINNETFKGHSPRPGSNIDAENLLKTFTKLGFNVESYYNQTRAQMMKIFKKGTVLHKKII